MTSENSCQETTIRLILPMVRNLQSALGALDVSDETKAHIWSELEEFGAQLWRRQQQLKAGGI